MGKLFARIFAECADESEAYAVLAHINSKLVALGPELMAPPYRYWKIPEYFGFDLDFGETSEAAYSAMLTFAHGGWHHGGDRYDRSSVWNYASGDHFLVPEVRWVEVQFTQHEP